MEIYWGHQGNYEGSIQELTNCSKDPSEEDKPHVGHLTGD